jgi:hypothetical protein
MPLRPPNIVIPPPVVKPRPPSVEIVPGKDATLAPIGAAEQIASSLRERLFNQARRIVPPAIVLDKITRTIEQGRTALPKKVAPPNGPMSQVAAMKLTRLEIHMLLDRSDQPYGTLASTDPKWIPVMMNPSEVIHSLKTRRADMATPGRVGAQRHYLGTENRTVSFKCIWDAFVKADDASSFARNLKDLAYARKFLEAMTAPSDGTNGLTGAPPRFLFFWARYCSLTCDLESINFRDDKFGPDGTLWGFEASFDLKEVGDIQITLESAMSGGLLRSEVKPPGNPAGDLGGGGGFRTA